MSFTLMKHHGWSLTEMENMLPFERDIYIMLLRQWLDEEHRKQKEQELKQRHG